MENANDNVVMEEIELTEEGKAEEAPQNFLDKLDSHKLGREYPEIWKILKWMIAGFIANVPELAVYMGLCSLFTLWNVVSYPNMFLFRFLAEHSADDARYGIAVKIYAYMISTAVGYAIAFVLNRKVTFHADSNVALSTFLYILLVILTIFMNGLIGPSLSTFAGNLPIGETLAEIVSKFICMLIPGLWVYPLNRFVIHRQHKPKAELEAA